MKEQSTWIRFVYIIGIISLALGSLDPMEGSVVIVVGSVLLALTTWFTHDRHRNLFMICSILIVIGVGFLFYLSSLGGIGGTSKYSMWWGLLILPYPVGWLTSIIVLILRATVKKSQKVTA